MRDPLPGRPIPAAPAPDRARITTATRALVAIRHPRVEALVPTGEPDGRATIREALEVTCSTCGDLTDWESIGDRPALIVLARRHAHDHHDDDVDAEGWTR